MLNPGEQLVGSICDVSENESDVHTLALAADYQATDKLTLNGSFVYNKAESSWDWDFAERMSLGNVVIRGTSTPVNTGPTYDTAEQNNLIDGYSDLSYEQYEITVGGTYQFSDALYATASLTYDIFESDEEYVYGDEDGKAYYSYFGVGYNF